MPILMLEFPACFANGFHSEETLEMPDIVHAALCFFGLLSGLGLPAAAAWRRGSCLGLVALLLGAVLGFLLGLVLLFCSFMRCFVCCTRLGLRDALPGLAAGCCLLLHSFCTGLFCFSLTLVDCFLQKRCVHLVSFGPGRNFAPSAVDTLHRLLCI